MLDCFLFLEEHEYAFSFSFELLIDSVILLALRNPSLNYLLKLLFLLYFLHFFMERFSHFLSNIFSLIIVCYPLNIQILFVLI